MAVHVSPLPFLADLVEFFTEGANAGGLTIDAEHCRDFAEALVELSEIVASMVALCEAHGLIERAVIPLDQTRTPGERHALAAEANASADGGVIRFPVAPARQVPVTEGGSAA